jgi:hypothetical protein
MRSVIYEKKDARKTDYEDTANEIAKSDLLASKDIADKAKNIGST